MLEMLLNPKRSEKRPWELFFVGFIYAGLSVILVSWIFSGDVVLSQYSGILIVTFTVMFSMPYIYYMIKMKEEEEEEEEFNLWKSHGKTIYALLWLFLGFIIAFSIFYIALGSVDNYQAQIETYCSINNPTNYDSCAREHGVITGKVTGGFSKRDMFWGIFANNLYVMIFTVVFSIIFGAGGIFILAWNASVISGAMVIFAKKDIWGLPLSLARYMIHGLPEIASYFIGTLAGGIIGLAIVRKEFKKEKFWDIMHDTLLLIIAGIILLVIAGLIEVYVTPMMFK